MTWTASIVDLCIALEFFCILLFIRTHYVAKVCRQELSRVHNELVEQIDNRTATSQTILDTYVDFDARVNFHRMLFMFHKWTHRQFFPEQYRDSAI